MVKPQNISRKTLSQQVYDVIRKKIVEKRYQPGESILESSLSKELGISRTPVREALKLLEKDKLVLVHPKKGAFITTVSLEKFREIWQIREIIEGEVGRQVVSFISKQDLAQIERKLRLIKKKFADWGEIDIKEAVTIGRELHNLIFNTFGNRTLIEFIDRLRFDMDRGCDFASQKSDNVLLFLDQHLEIIAALKSGDGDRVKQLLYDHVRDARNSALD